MNPKIHTNAQISSIKQSWTKTAMLIATLLTTAKLYKQPRYPLTDEWVKKMRYRYTKSNSAIKKN
jgi:hypothetical protein